ncbi:MAG: hypothetical protein ABEN55_11290 [Bradymonadaceae bacterium]
MNNLLDRLNRIDGIDAELSGEESGIRAVEHDGNEVAVTPHPTRNDGWVVGVDDENVKVGVTSDYVVSFLELRQE